MSDPFDAFISSNPYTNGEAATKAAEDPAAEFLAREQAELDKIENNTFGDFNAEPVATNGFTNDFDSLNLKDSSEVVTNEKQNYENEEKYNEDMLNEPQSFDQEANAEASDPFSAISRVDKLTQEPEKIKVWREEQRIRLQTKDAEEEQKKKEWKEAAKKELEDWYKNRQEQLAKTHGNNKVSNKAAEAELVGPTSNANEWERLAKLCDFNPKANKNNKDVSRLRSILLQLKQQPLVR